MGRMVGREASGKRCRTGQLWPEMNNNNYNKNINNNYKYNNIII